MDFSGIFFDDGKTSGRTVYNQGLITGILKVLNRKLILTSDGSVEQILTSRECREIIADAVEITREKHGNQRNDSVSTDDSLKDAGTDESHVVHRAKPEGSGS